MRSSIRRVLPLASLALTAVTGCAISPVDMGPEDSADPDAQQAPSDAQITADARDAAPADGGSDGAADVATDVAQAHDGGSVDAGGADAGRVDSGSVDGGHVSPLLVPAHGAWLGSTNDRLAIIEGEIGRRYDIVHTYHGWTDAFPTSGERTLSDEGRMLLLDWDSGIAAPWAAIARGDADATIDAEATRLREFGRPVFFNFNHEPEADVGRSGSASDFVAAFRHIRERFTHDGVTNAIYVWDVMGFNLTSAEALYPGDAWVDWIAWDPYNWYGCNPTQHAQIWRTFEQIVQPFYAWATANHPGKPLMLGEYGTNEDPADPTRKAEWFTQSLVDLETIFPALRATVYFNQGAPTFCDRWVDTSPESTAAYRAIAQAPFYNQPHH